MARSLSAGLLLLPLLLPLVAGSRDGLWAKTKSLVVNATESVESAAGSAAGGVQSAASYAAGSVQSAAGYGTNSTEPWFCHGRPAPRSAKQPRTPAG